MIFRTSSPAKPVVETLALSTLARKLPYSARSAKVGEETDHWWSIPAMLPHVITYSAHRFAKNI